MWVGSQLLVPLAFKEYFSSSNNITKKETQHFIGLLGFGDSMSHMGVLLGLLYWLTANQHALSGDQTTGFIGNGSTSRGVLFTYGTSPS